MTGDADEIRNPSLHHGGAPAAFVAVIASLSLSLAGDLDKEASIDRVARNPDDYSIISDDQLLMTAQSGDQQAFVEPYCRHSPMAQMRIFPIVRSHGDSEDAFQDTSPRASRHLGTLRRTSKFSAWLTSIGVNTPLMTLPKGKTSKQRPTSLLNDESGAWETVEHMDLSLNLERQHSRHQIVLVVRREFDRLRPSHRSIINPSYGTECSPEQSAKAMEISVSNASPD
jgi:DNA-directed RNA polymerase specialized sigma24 family protein